jgi:hypothetical protein
MMNSDFFKFNTIVHLFARYIRGSNRFERILIQHHYFSPKVWDTGNLFFFLFFFLTHSKIMMDEAEQCDSGILIETSEVSLSGKGDFTALPTP